MKFLKFGILGIQSKRKKWLVFFIIVLLYLPIQFFLIVTFKDNTLLSFAGIPILFTGWLLSSEFPIVMAIIAYFCGDLMRINIIGFDSPISFLFSGFVLSIFTLLGFTVGKLAEHYRAEKRQLIEHKKMEEEKTELREHLYQVQKMEAIGYLAGGIAHDFNNMLSVITGYSDLIKEKYSKNNPTLKKYTNSILRVSKNAADLITQLLAFARKGKNINTEVNIHEIVENVIESFITTIDKHIQIIRHLNANPPIIQGDNSQIQNVLLNLVMNARDAMPEGGKLTFTTDIVKLDEKYAQNRHYNITTGTYLMISITDTGTGMNKETRTRVFEPFFTTKEIGKGTGLGLASVYGIIKNHDGYIEVYSEIGKGSTFKVHLPVAEKIKMKEPDTTKIIRKGSGSILIVDDEEMIRRMCTEMLMELGYHTVTCKDGQEAVDYYNIHFREIDLAIIDIVMPVLNGYECFLKFKKINPKIKAIVASGYIKSEESIKMINNGVLEFIRKPFDISKLSRAVDNALNKEIE